MPHVGSPSVGHPVVSGEGRWVSSGGPPGTGVVGPVHPTVDAEGRWVSDDRNPEDRNLDEGLGFTASAPGGVRQPWEFRPPSGGHESYFGAPGDLWSGMVDWWFSHDIPTEGLPSGGGLMIGPQETAKLANFLKDALLPLMAGDIGLAGVGGLGRFDPLPLPAGQIIGKGADVAKAGVRAVRGAVRGGDEAVEAAARVVRGDPAAGAWREAYEEAELVPIEFFDDVPSWNRGAARAGDVEIDVWHHRVKAEYEAMGERSFENFDELVDDMAEHGLDNPLVVDFNPDTGDVILSEGNHRLAAARELGWDAIPVRVFRSTQTAADRGAPIEKIMPTFGETKFGRSLDAFGEDMAQNISPSQVGVPTASGVARETGETGLRPAVKGATGECFTCVVDDANQLVDTFKEAGLTPEAAGGRVEIVHGNVRDLEGPHGWVEYQHGSGPQAEMWVRDSTWRANDRTFRPDVQQYVLPDGSWRGPREFYYALEGAEPVDRYQAVAGRFADELKQGPTGG